MQIEEGKTYVDEAGVKVGPMQQFDTTATHRKYRERVADGRWWASDGDAWGEATHKLIAEWVDEAPGGSLPGFSHNRWAALVDASYDQIKSLAAKKGGEYSGDDDRLLNFRRNGAALGLPMETVWAVYAGKHWDAIQQFIKDQRNGKERERLEPIAGRVDDLLVYLLLFKAMLEEGGSTPPAEEWRSNVISPKTGRGMTIDELRP